MITDKLRMLHQNFNDSKNDYLFLGIPILISVIVKLVLLIVLWDSPINNDGTLYINAAKQYAMGNFAEGLALYPMPVYPLLLAFFHIVIPDWIIAGYFISSISFVLVIIPLYYITKLLFGVRSGFFACIVFAILPRMNEWSLNISRDPLFALLLILCIYVALKYISENNSFLFILTFILAWCATLIRIEGVLFIGFYFLVLVFFAIIDKEHRFRYLLKSLIWVGFPLVIALFTLLSSGVRGIAVNRFDNVFIELTNFFSGKFLTNPIDIYNFLSEAIPNPPFFNGHYSFATLCRHFMPFIYMLGIIQVLIKILFPLSFIPLYFGFKNRANIPDGYTHSAKIILWVCVLYIGLGYYFLVKHDFIATRHLMIPAFLLLPWIGNGLDWLYEKASICSHKKATLFLILIIILAPTIKTFRLVSSNDSTITQTVQWLKDNEKINTTQIVSNDYKLAFYIDLNSEGDSQNSTQYYDRYNTSLDIKKLEKFAIEQKAQIVVMRMKTKNKDQVENFQFYHEINSFIGHRYTIFIYNRTYKK